MTTDIGVFSLGRTQSQRCPNKMLRPFAGTTLTDIVLEKLARAGRYAFFAALEDEFRAKCDRHRVDFIPRDLRSARIDEPIREILGFLEEVACEHLLLVSGCLPFLRSETIQGFLDECVAGGCRPAFSVIRRQNYFMGMDRRPLNFDPGVPTINTKTVQPVYEFAHALYFFNRRFFLQHGRYWDWGEVRLIEIPGGLELLDIDTEEDFRMAEALWRSGAGELPAPVAAAAATGRTMNHDP